MLARRPRPLLVRSAEQRRAPDRADAQAGRRVAAGRLADRARIRGQRPEADQGRPRRAGASARWLSPHSTLEELHLLGKLVRGLGSENIDYRLRHADFATPRRRQSRWLGTLDRLAVDAAARAGRRLQPAQGPSAVRAAHPRRRRARARRCTRIDAVADDWAHAGGRHASCVAAERLAAGAGAMCAGASAAARRASPPPAERRGRRRRARPIAAVAAVAASARRSCSATPPRTIAQASTLLALANWIGEQTGASVGYLTEAANTVGAQLVGALPGAGRPRTPARCSAGGAARPCCCSTPSRSSTPPPAPPRSPALAQAADGRRR